MDEEAQSREEGACLLEKFCWSCFLVVEKFTSGKTNKNELAICMNVTV